MPRRASEIDGAVRSPSADHDEAVGDWRDLPVGSFASSGINVPTGYCIYWKPMA
ncbi:hypothetical protein [Roseobacter fucihabitans]|uniref:hypothetical protein n=1 Tax=Roseobacter fucihabitans TaxID=1537242 RepID=UPI001652F6F7|nr:hypothetical protein [Roseobacter litoralis]